MKSVFLILLLPLSLNSLLFSQFKEGYIIGNNDDTTHGYIEFEGSIKNCSQCKFKPGTNNESRLFLPGDIKGFRFNEGKYFITSEIPIDRVPKKVFLEWLIKGRASMLSYAPSDVNLPVRYFILLENDSLFELLNTAQVREIKGSNNYISTYNIEKKEYIGMLKYYFRDCPDIMQDINNTVFTSKSLIRITKEYHEKTCDTEECIIFEDKNRKLKTDIGLTFTSIYSQLKLNNSVPENAYLTQSYGYGISFKFSNLPLLSPKFSVRSQILYANLIYSYDTEGLYWGDENKICQYDNLRIPIQISYKFSHNKLSPFVSGGLNANLRFGYKEFNQFLLNYVTEHFDYTYGVSFFQLGLNAGLGLEYQFLKELAIDVGFEYEYAMNFFGTYRDDGSSTHNYFIQTSLLYKL